MIPLFKQVPLKKIVLGFDVLNVLGNILYALGGFSGSYATVLVGRAISGTVGYVKTKASCTDDEKVFFFLTILILSIYRTSGPSFPTTYLARATSKVNRSKYMAYVSVSLGLGYSIGPATGLLLEVICNAAGWDGKS